ncbi:MAG: diguanylate cyclase domain-containing protein [Bacillota bacterium]
MYKFLKKYRFLVIVALAIVIFIISYINYSNSKKLIKEKYEGRQKLVEKNILETVNYINDSYQIAEEQLNSEMKKYSQIMRKKYKENPDVMSWDLEKLKKEFEDYNIYIINKDLKIIRSTFKEDIGLDFSKYSSFTKILKRRLNSDTFAADRLDLATSTGEIKKYSYMPTHDNNYLLELSINVQEKYPSLRRLDIFGDASDLTEEYEMVEEISFYSVEPIHYNVGKLRSSKKPYINPDVAELEKRLASQTIISDEMQNKTINTNDENHTYKFFPAFIADKDEQIKGWNSYVVGLIYNNDVMANEMDKHRNLYSLNIFLMIIVFAVFIAIVVYLLNKFEYQAYHDQLTSLANREYFEDRFLELKNKVANNNKKIGILFLDIDKFKKINDEYGHNIGDKVLKEVAMRLEKNLKNKDCLARLGGDEFVIMIADINSKKQLFKVAKRVVKAFDTTLEVGEKEFNIKLSGGISIYPTDGKNLEKLLQNADYAMYKAKEKDKDLELSDDLK